MIKRALTRQNQTISRRVKLLYQFRGTIASLTLCYYKMYKYLPLLESLFCDLGKFALRPARRLGGVILSGTNKNGRNVAGKRGTDGNPTTQVVLQTLYARLASKLYGLCKDRGCSATCRQRAVIKSNAKSKLTGLPICILQSRCFPAPSCLTRRNPILGTQIFLS